MNWDGLHIWNRCRLIPDKQTDYWKEAHERHGAKNGNQLETGWFPFFIGSRNEDFLFDKKCNLE